MFKITVNDGPTRSVEPLNDGSFKVDGQPNTPDMVEVRNGVLHVILNNRSYTAEVIRHDAAEKLFHIRVNDNTYKVQVNDKYDELLKALGFDALQSGKAADLKAPMPGLVVDVAVSEGQEVKKGDKLLVLEAMKMENVLKSPADGMVKKIHVKKGSTVEKNEILILFS